jgi:hypothetical protein
MRGMVVFRMMFQVDMGFPKKDSKLDPEPKPSQHWLYISDQGHHHRLDPTTAPACLVLFLDFITRLF